ncbi:MAG TPA: MCE family protein [Acidiferrobacteraceae bacterium]|nr:MCE family protein [Acidiferrobacteraceae bacterium]
MKQDKINYILVGSFVAVVLTVFLVLMALLSGRGGATDSYSATFTNISGLDLGTAVTYEGFQVGHVENVDAQQKEGVTRYHVKFGVKKGWKIPTDSVAYIQAAGLLAAVTIDIKEGKSKVHHKPGAELKGRVSEDMFAAIAEAANDAGELLASLQKSAKGLEELLTGPNGARLSSAIGQFDASLTQANRLLISTNGFLQHNRGDINQVIGDLKVTMDVVAEHIDSIAFNLEETSGNLREFTRQVRARPSSLIRGGGQKTQSRVEDVD